MSQQQFAPQYPGQPYQQPPAQPAYPQAYPAQQTQPYPQVQQGYPPQVPPAQPTVPLAQGSLSDFYNQPSTGGGPSISWTDKNTQAQKPIGTQYVGVVARDVTSSDIQQQTDFRTQQPKFYRDGRPMFSMKVPLKVQPSPEFPEGEAAWYVKGQAKDELQRAMSAAGAEGAPKEGAVITITLVQRRPSGPGMNPANIVQVTYQPAQGGAAPQTNAAAQPTPVQQVAPQDQPVPQQPVQQQFVPQAQPVAQAQPVQPQQYVQQPAVPQGQPQQYAQVPAQPGALPAPETLSPAQQQLFAQLAAGQQQAAQPAAQG
ncbi:hypothetical protein RB608_11820 [Nocardioides sp. LHD-245]|uniref:hypothetical protein n=1 Tax=Nocardioides sp. LHD-245 TaxID=3051387 RepID=UPI0027DEE260|nr:hypothetical protein [Nocardioides sp. LHD-245]